jgi:carbamoyl-phosphate synthase large subunit
VIRPFTLGGRSGYCIKKDFDVLLTRGLEASPIHEVLIDKALMGWKEYELELLRDKNDNVVYLFNRKYGSYGIHTGDSITVAPAMTLRHDISKNA